MSGKLMTGFEWYLYRQCGVQGTDDRATRSAYRPYLRRDCIRREARSTLENAALLKLPFAVVERADVPGLEPARDAVEVECVLQGRVGGDGAHAIRRDARQIRVGERAAEEVAHVADAPGGVALL